MSLRMGLLALLDQADMGADELRAAFEAWTAGMRTFPNGQVDATLGRMAQEGMVVALHGSGAHEPSAPGYSITRTGRDAVAAWFATGAPTSLASEELVEKVRLALPHGTDHAGIVIDRQRRALVAALQEQRRTRRRASSGAGRAHGVAVLAELPPRFVEDATFARVEADLRWLDRCEAQLTRVRNGGTAA